MPLLLDAYNILHVVGVLPPDLAGIDLEELADLVADSRFRGEETLLICDGVPKRHGVAHPSVHVRFAGPGRTADETIMRFVRRSSAPKRITVVTSDREIVQAVRRRRAGVIGSERFLAMLAEDHTAPGARPRPTSTTLHPSDRRQVEAWLRLFDLDPDLEDLPASEVPPARDRDRAASDRPQAGQQSGRQSGPGPGQNPGHKQNRKPDPASAATGTSRPPRSRTTRRSILDASTLSEIDPSTLDDLDTARLLDPDADTHAASDDHPPTKTDPA